jgi:hypothetical protein
MSGIVHLSQSLSEPLFWPCYSVWVSIFCVDFSGVIIPYVFETTEEAGKGKRLRSLGKGFDPLTVHIAWRGSTFLETFSLLIRKVITGPTASVAFWPVAFFRFESTHMARVS